jgi:uncharacterized membrane protein YeaQ/YmgE (transglycosylase-associated protein family)
MLIASWIVIGLVLGSTARMAMPGPAAGGMPVAILIGVIGAVIGGIAGATLAENGTEPVYMSALTAAAGAMYPLFAYRCFALRFENRIGRLYQPLDDCNKKCVMQSNSNDTQDVTIPSSSPTKQLASTTAPLSIGR